MKKRLCILFICVCSVFLVIKPNLAAAFAERPVVVLVAATTSTTDYQLFHTEIKRRLFFPEYKTLPLEKLAAPIKSKQPLSIENLDAISTTYKSAILVLLNIHEYEQHLAYTPFSLNDDYTLTNLKMDIYFYDKEKKIFIYRPYKYQNVDFVLSADKISDLAREQIRQVLNSYLIQSKESV